MLVTVVRCSKDLNELCLTVLEEQYKRVPSSFVIHLSVCLIVQEDLVQMLSIETTRRVDLAAL